MTNRLELLIDTGSAAIFGGAAFWCTAALVPAVPLAPIAAGAGGVLSVFALMKKVGAGPRHRLPALQLAPLPLPPEAGELSLAADDAVADELLLEIGDALGEELVLDAPLDRPTVAEAQARIASAFDALAPFAPVSPVADEALDLDDPLPPADDRVVALFGGDRAAANPADLKARIDAHLAARAAAVASRGEGAHLAPLPDAGDALDAALDRMTRPQR